MTENSLPRFDHMRSHPFHRAEITDLYQRADYLIKNYGIGGVDGGAVTYLDGICIHRDDNNLIRVVADHCDSWRMELPDRADFAPSRHLKHMTEVLERAEKAAITADRLESRMHAFRVEFEEDKSPIQLVME